MGVGIFAVNVVVAKSNWNMVIPVMINEELVLLVDDDFVEHMIKSPAIPKALLRQCVDGIKIILKAPEKTWLICSCYEDLNGAIAGDFITDVFIAGGSVGFFNERLPELTMEFHGR